MANGTMILKLRGGIIWYCCLLMSDFLLGSFNITIFNLGLNPLLFLIVFIMCLLEILCGALKLFQPYGNHQGSFTEFEP